MYASETDAADDSLELPRPRVPFRKATTGPGRDRKMKARRTSRRKQGGSAIGGIHRRGSKRRSN